MCYHFPTRATTQSLPSMRRGAHRWNFLLGKQVLAHSLLRALRLVRSKERHKPGWLAGERKGDWSLWPACLKASFSAAVSLTE